MNIHRRFRGARSIAALALLSVATFAPAQTILHVNGAATPGGNGLTWATAFDTLDGALAAAKANNNVLEVWVATGTYSANAPFDIRDRLGVYGGFVGTEVLRQQRNPSALATTLDGLGQHGVVTFPNSATTAAALDGFTIVRGSASDGGAVYTYGGSPTLANLVVAGNTATADGGGIYSYQGSPVLTSVVFRNNVAGDDGGGLYCYQGNPTLIGVLFDNNQANDDGGGFYDYTGDPTLVDVVFRGNKTVGGSGADGGGCYNYEGDPKLTRVQFFDNTATGRGGGFSTYDGIPVLVNCLFVRNSASSGGAIRNYDGPMRVINTTITANTATSNGGGIYSQSMATVDNSVVYGNTAPSNAQLTGATVRYSCVQGGVAGTGNIASDPMFKSPTTDDYRPSATSACIDAGDNAALPAGTTSDLALNARRLDEATVPDTGAGTAPIVDIGAFEYTADYPGTGDDLVLLSAIGSASLPTQSVVKAVTPGQAVRLRVLSPNGSLVGGRTFLGVQLFVTSVPPAPVPGLAGLWITPGLGTWIEVSPLPSGGLDIVAPVPAATPVGLSFLVQYGVASPSTINSVYAATDADEIRVQ